MTTVDTADDGSVLAIGRRFRATLDRFNSLEERWVLMADDAPGKLEAATVAYNIRAESERLFLAVLRRRSESLAGVAVMAAHGLVALDRSGLDSDGSARLIALARRALADIATTTAKAAAVDLSGIGPPTLRGRLRACLGR